MLPAQHFITILTSHLENVRLGHKRALNRFYPMSALPPKADIDGSYRDVRFVPEADM
jgi:hypothetical protein